MGKLNIITGAAGFIGSVLGRELGDSGMDNIIAVDDFSKKEKEIATFSFNVLFYKGIIHNGLLF